MTGLSTAELAIYAILSPPAAYILFKHGRPGLLGWAFLFSFFTLRIVGGALNMAGDSSAGIISSVGLSPLLLAANGILHEARVYRYRHLDTKVEWIKVLLFHIQVTTGVALLAVGVSGLESSDPSSNDETLVKVGIAILFLAWVILSGWAALSLRSPGRVQDISTQQMGTTLLYSVLFTSIFIGIRVIYALVALTSNKSYLNPINGSLAIRVVLGFLPELITSLGFLAAGYHTRNIRKLGKEYSQGDIQC